MSELVQDRSQPMAGRVHSRRIDEHYLSGRQGEDSKLAPMGGLRPG
jgi:hypothetical protein